MAEVPFDRTSPLAEGQRLQCSRCGSEIEIVTPCPCDPPDQVFRCCGEPMLPAEGTAPRMEPE